MPLEIDFAGYDVESIIYPPGERVSPFDGLRADPHRPQGRNRPQTVGAGRRLIRDPNWIVGLDLGQSQDFTALVALEIIRPSAPGDRVVYRVPFVTRAPLGTSYTAIAARVADLLGTPPLKGCTHLVADATGVGRPVVDVLRDGPVQPVAITITAGHAVSGGGLEYNVPKRDLATSLQVAFQQNRLKIAAESENAETLARELADFRVKISAGGSDQFGAWREGQHDDLVLALALAVWWAEFQTRRRPQRQIE